MLASTIQFSHNTPHHANNHANSITTAVQSVGYNQGIMPQTPNNAPNTSFKTCWLISVHHSWLRYISTRFKHGGSKTFVYSTTNHTTPCGDDTNWCLKLMLLRKEVIHPHLPVRVPCYDFVPIADPTLDSSLTSLSHWLRVLPTFMT